MEGKAEKSAQGRTTSKLFSNNQFSGIAEESLFEEVMAGIPVATFIMDKDWTITHFNKAAWMLTGWTPEDAIGRKVRDVLGSAVRRKGGKVARALESGIGIEINSIDILNLDGEVIKCSLIFRPILNEKDRVIGGMGFFRRSEENDGVSPYIEDIPLPVMAVDEDLKITYLNPAGLKMLDKELENVVGEKCYRVLEMDHCQSEDCPARIAMKHDRTVTVDTSMNLSGESLDIRYTSCPLKDDDEDTIGAVGYIIDATRENEMTNRILELIKEANDGDIKARLVPEEFEGNFRMIAEGVNSILDAYLTPLKLANRYLREIAKGEIPSEVEMDFKGDFNILTANINGCVGAINGLIKDTNILVEAAQAGDITKRADTSNHQGDYRKIVEGINEALDAVADKVFWYEQILDAVPFPMSVTDMDMKWTFVNKAGEMVVGKNRKDILGMHCSNWKGPICGTDDCGINCLRGGQSQTYSNRGGKNLQIDVAHLNDKDGKPIGHIELVQDISKIKKVEEYQSVEVERLENNLKQLANGILELNLEVADADEYTGETRENFLRINRSLSVLVEAIEAVSSDISLITEAGTEGRLDTRVDAMNHQGRFRDIIDGLNSTLDAVTKPLNEAMRIANLYANGDLTARIEIETKGDFNDFSESLDNIGDSLTQLLVEVNNAIRMVSSTSQELASSAEEMNASTEQVSSAIQQISRGAQSQASQVDETAKVMQEMSDLVSDVAHRSKSASESSENTRESASVGQGTVDSTIKKMQEIENVVTESAGVIEELGRRSEEIGQIVDVITNISDQTNLLALNAAIEAARAGEQGRGFAVVAEEVKNLAEDSREAAERIAKMIKEVQVETQKAVNSMQKGKRETAEGMQIIENMGEVFLEIAGMATKASEEVAEIANLMVKQKEGMERTATSVDSIASIAEETASASEESASSTEELTASMEDMTARAQALSEMALNLQRIVGQFEIGEDLDFTTTTNGKSKSNPVSSTPISSSVDRGKPKIPSKVKKALAKRGMEISDE